MKRCYVTMLVMGAAAGAAHAATLSLKWAADEGSPTMWIAPGMSRQVNVYLDLPNDNGAVGTVFFSFASNPDDDLYLDHTSTTPMAGWAAGGQSGYLGELAQFAVADPWGQQPIRNGSFLVGSFRVEDLSLCAYGLNREIYANAHGDQGVLDPAGDPLTWDARYHASYDSFVAYGEWGSPSWDPPGAAEGQDANPLIGFIVPEPASCAWLILAAAGLLRRR